MWMMQGVECFLEPGEKHANSGLQQTLGNYKTKLLVGHYCHVFLLVKDGYVMPSPIGAMAKYGSNQRKVQKRLGPNTC